MSNFCIKMDQVGFESTLPGKQKRTAFDLSVIVTHIILHDVRSNTPNNTRNIEVTYDTMHDIAKRHATFQYVRNPVSAIFHVVCRAFKATHDTLSD